MTSRRQFIQLLPVAAGTLAASSAALAQAQLVDEKSAQAVAVGYVADSTKADKAKYKNHAASQTCGGCALFQGQAGAATGGCAVFPGKQVAAKGWCSAYAKKP